MKVNSKLKLIAVSVSLLASIEATADLGGLSVNSSLGQPFSGTVVASGDEAEKLFNGGKITLSDRRLSVNVRKVGGNAIITLRSSSPINDPVLSFRMGVGSQTRQYSAIIDPKGYQAKSTGTISTGTVKQPVTSNHDRAESSPSQTASKSSSSSTKSNSSHTSKPVAKRTPVVPKRTTPKRSTSMTEQHMVADAIAEQTTIAAGEYIVQKGESFNTIAQKIRPEGLTAKQTAAALIKANPNAGQRNNPSVVYPGTVINIPTEEELIRLANGGSLAESTQPVVDAPSKNTSEQTPAPTTTETKTQPASDTKVATTSEPKVQPASETKATTASEPTTQTASEAVASTTVASTEAKVASETKPTVPAKPKKAPPPPAPIEEPEDNSLWMLLAAGGLGAILLFLLAKLLLSKKKGNKKPNIPITNAAEPKEKVKGKKGKKDKTKATTATTAAIAGSTSKDEDLFFGQNESFELQDGGTADFDLNLNDIDTDQGIISSAVTNDAETQSRKNADWDKIESTESVYEDDDISSVSAPAFASSKSTTSNLSSASDDSLDLSNIDSFDLNTSSTNLTKSNTTEASINLSESSDNSLDFSLDLGNSFDLSSHNEAKASTQATNISDDILSFDVADAPIIATTIDEVSVPATPSSVLEVGTQAKKEETKPKRSSWFVGSDDDNETPKPNSLNTLTTASAAVIGGSFVAANQSDPSDDSFDFDLPVETQTLDSTTNSVEVSQEPADTLSNHDLNFDIDISENTAPTEIFNNNADDFNITSDSNDEFSLDGLDSFDLNEDNNQPSEASLEVSTNDFNLDLSEEVSLDDELAISDFSIDSPNTEQSENNVESIDTTIANSSFTPSEPLDLGVDTVATAIEDVSLSSDDFSLEQVEPLDLSLNNTEHLELDNETLSLDDFNIDPDSLELTASNEDIQVEAEMPATSSIDLSLDETPVDTAFDLTDASSQEIKLETEALEATPSFDLSLDDTSLDSQIDTSLNLADTGLSLESNDDLSFNLDSAIADEPADVLVSNDISLSDLSLESADTLSFEAPTEVQVSESLPQTSELSADLSFDSNEFMLDDSDSALLDTNLNLDDSINNVSASLVTESVGMTAPLEAKYELAEMYIEIGDPDAARETLQELIEESSGEILEKSKALLKRID